MKYTIALFSILAALTFCFFSCQKDIDLKIADTHISQLYVESILYVGESPKVFLSKSVTFFNEKVTPQEVFVRNAVVEISDGNLVYLLQQDSTFDKFRCRWNPYYTTDLIVAPNVTYRLTVRHEGQEITGEASTDLKPIEVEEVEYTPDFYDVYGGHDGVIVRFTDVVGEGDFYRFQMDRWVDTTRYHAHVFDGFINTCVDKDELFFVSDLGRSIFSDSKIDGTSFELYLEVSFEYLEGDTAIIYMQTLDVNAARFYDTLDKQLESINNPFVEPTFLDSTVKGGIGVFGAAIRSEGVAFIYPQDSN